MGKDDHSSTTFAAFELEKSESYQITFRSHVLQNLFEAQPGLSVGASAGAKYHSVIQNLDLFQAPDGSLKLGLTEGGLANAAAMAEIGLEEGLKAANLPEPDRHALMAEVAPLLASIVEKTLRHLPDDPASFMIA